MSSSLYSVVETYAALGDHRTGTAVDDTTIKWFAAELESRGAVVDLHPYTFDRYDARWEVTVGNEAVDSFPLFYEGVGRVTTDQPTVGSVEAFALLVGQAVHAPLADAARANGTGVVVCATTGGHDGSLVVPNRAPQPAGQTPVLLVEGRAGPRLDTERVTVDLDARIVDGRSSNVVARFGDGADPIIIATPLSGWFRCAGERGTGIAVALDVAARLADDCPVIVVGTTGHELIDLGLKRLLETWEPQARAIVHLGACVAAAEAPGALSRARRCNLSVPDHVGANLSSALAGAELDANFIPADVRRQPDRWVGEAREWCTLGRPLVSVAGHYPYFHSPQDLPEVATSPELLDRVADAVAEAGRLLSKL